VNHKSNLQGIQFRRPNIRQIRLPKPAASRFQINDLGILHGQQIPVLAYHYPWPGIGHIAKTGEGFHYVPEPRQL
jgi:hypothetical protein